MIYKSLHTSLIIFMISLSLSAGASDYDKEQRWADQISDALLDGEPYYLNAQAHEFLGIHTEPGSTSSKGVVLLHGSGVHPDWQTVIYPLRVELAEKGWHTMSIQMPVLANDAEQQDYIELFPQVPARIDAAIKFLQDRQITEIHLIGHSLGASMGAYYLSSTPSSVNSFVAIGLTTGIKDTAMDNLAHLTAISVPVLDLYGTQDLENIVEFADDRKTAANPNIDYQQIVVADADHFFDGEESQLLENVYTWLNSF